MSFQSIAPLKLISLSRHPVQCFLGRRLASIISQKNNFADPRIFEVNVHSASFYFSRSLGPRAACTVGKVREEPVTPAGKKLGFFWDNHEKGPTVITSGCYSREFRGFHSGRPSWSEERGSTLSASTENLHSSDRFGFEVEEGPSSTTYKGDPQTTKGGKGPKTVMDVLLKRLKWGFSTWPTAEGWLFTLCIASLIAIPIIPLALWGNLFSLDHANISFLVGLKILIPNIAEELLWRLLLNPHPREERSPKEVMIWGVISTAAFVMSHPLNAWLLRPVARTVFCHPGFLLICGLLGSACVVLYQRTGSIWPPVAMHWLTVFVWLSLGGRHRAPLF